MRADQSGLNRTCEYLIASGALERTALNQKMRSIGKLIRNAESQAHLRPTVTASTFYQDSQVTYHLHNQV